MSNHLTRQKIKDISSQQLFTLERKISKSEFSIETIGNYLPGNILVTDLNQLSIEYMNINGCNILGHNVKELQELGSEYYQRFFVPEEIDLVISTYQHMQKQQDVSGIFNFAHRVKAVSNTSYKWYFASAKLMFSPGQPVADKMLLIVNEVNSLGNIAKKINSVLEESDGMKQHFKKFCRLSKREKEIIFLLVSGQNTNHISEILNLSRLTVNTHRRNIKQKLEIKTFSELYKFALVFDLIS